MEAVDYIWLNGEVIPWDAAQVHVLSHALHYGYGVFEGIRAYECSDGRTAVFRLDDHMRRLADSAKIIMLSMPYTPAELATATKELIRVNGLKSCYIRPLVFSGSGGMGLHPGGIDVDTVIAVWPWGAYLGEDGIRHGVRVKTSSYRRIESSVLPPAAKTSGNYVNSILAKMEATKAGYDEAILLNLHGYVTDGSGENVFVIRDGLLTTPPLSAGALAGITRASIIRIAGDLGYEVREENVVRTDLYLADEAFFTGTAAEVVPIREIDDREIGEPGPITKKLQETFFATIHGDVEEYREWLSYV